MPARYARRWAALGFVAVLVIGLAAAIVLVQPIVGGPAVTAGGIGVALPAALFAVAVAVSEEVAWRGAFLAWLGRLLGPFLAALSQSVLYGLSWGVVTGSTLGGVVAGAAGLFLAAVVIRTRSLLVVVAWHAAFNAAFYLVVACRPG